MSEGILHKCHVLIVEDEFLLVEDLRYELTKAGAIVVGAASTVRDAFELIEADGKLDCAILDMNLGGQLVFPVADRLLARGVPFVFATGYDASITPPRFKEALRCEKPLNMARLLQSIKQVIEA